MSDSSALRPLVYIAGPLSNGDTGASITQAERNIREAMLCFSRLLKSGLVVPICPHWSHFQCLVAPVEYEDWLDYDMQLIPRCNALIRLDGPSVGADREVAKAKELGIRVFNFESALLYWAEFEWPKKQGESKKKS